MHSCITLHTAQVYRGVLTITYVATCEDTYLLQVLVCMLPILLLNLGFNCSRKIPNLKSSDKINPTNIDL